MSSNECTIVVSSCDKYSDIWDSFFYLLKKYWPDCKYNILLNTETLKYSYPGLSIVVVNYDKPNSSWTERLANTVKQATSNQILLLLDDFFLCDYVDSSAIANCVKWLNNDSKIATFTLWAHGIDGIECEYKGFERRPNDGKLKVPAIAGVWNKSKLLSYLSHDENPWQWEINASDRSNQTSDEFYVMEFDPNCIEPYIFPYNFRKYGLIGGKWTPESAEFFKQNNMKMDFSTRGFYDESMQVLTPSFVAAVELDSSILPYYELLHEGDPCLLYDSLTSSSGSFKQTYQIQGAKKMVLWEPAFICGFGIEKFKAIFTFKDGNSEAVEYNDVFGNFVVIEQTMLFVKSMPTVYIPCSNNDLIETLDIEGVFVKPLSEKTLVQANSLASPPIPANQELYTSGIWREWLISPRKNYYKRVRPQLFFGNTLVAESDKRYWPGSFSINYPISSNIGSPLLWRPSDDNGFTIENLRIEVKSKNGNTTNLKYYKKADGFFEIQNHVVFLNQSQDIYFNLPDELFDEVTVSGILHYPIPRNILRVLVYGDDNSTIGVFEQKLGLCKRVSLALKTYGIIGVAKKIFRRKFSK